MAIAAGTRSRVSAEGGPASPVTTLDPARREWSHLWPRFLRDGSHFLYPGRKPSGTDHTYPLFVATLEGRENRELFSVSSAVAYPGGRLLYQEAARQRLGLQVAAGHGEVQVAGEARFGAGGNREAADQSPGGGSLTWPPGPARVGPTDFR